MKTETSEGRLASSTEDMKIVDSSPVVRGSRTYSNYKVYSYKTDLPSPTFEMQAHLLSVGTLVSPVAVMSRKRGTV